MVQILLGICFLIGGMVFSQSSSDFNIFIHELGHWIYGLGGTIAGYVTYINVDWPLASVGSLLFQMQLALLTGKLARKYFTPMAGFGIGWANWLAVEVFMTDGAEFSYDIKRMEAWFYVITVVYLIRIYVNLGVLIWERITGVQPKYVGLLERLYVKVKVAVLREINPKDIKTT